VQADSRRGKKGATADADRHAKNTSHLFLFAGYPCANAVENPPFSLRDPYSAQPLVKSTD
jgi:hypothetical protein